MAVECVRCCRYVNEKGETCHVCRENARSGDATLIGYNPYKRGECYNPYMLPIVGIAYTPEGCEQRRLQRIPSAFSGIIVYPYGYAL